MSAYQNVICPECAQRVGATPRASFLGFPIFVCPCCHKEAKLPLATARAVVYLAVAVLSLAFCVAILAQGDIPMIGVLPSLAIAALVIDRSVRGRARAARARHALRT